MTDSPIACVTLPHGRQLYVYTPESNVSYKVANKTPVTEIDPDFDVSRVSNTSGGNFTGGVINFTSNLFSYDYRANDLHIF